MSDTFNTTSANWQGVDDEPIVGSNNLVKSGGVANALYMVHNQRISEEEEKILIQDNLENVIHELTPEYANFKNLKSNGNDVLTGSNITEEVIHGDYDEEIEIKGIESYIKIGRYGIKAKGYYDIEGNLLGVLQGKDYNDARYNLRFANSLLLEARKNPFELAPLNDGYISFVWDDLRSDIDKVASIFAEYNFPICIAAIPSKLNNICNGLSEASQGYTVGMTAKEVCERVVELGGEIMAHNGPYITIDNENDFEFMFNHFVTTKRTLEDNGFVVRGLIRAGGAPSGKKPHADTLNKWLIGNYEYSNLGSVAPYTQGRDINLDSNDLSQLKSSVLSLKQNHRWTGVMAHQLNDGGSNFITESNLRELLSYISEIGLNVVTYAYINDHFHSSKFLNSLNN